MDPRQTTDNLKGPAEPTPPPSASPRPGDTGAVGHAPSVESRNHEKQPSVKALAVRGSVWAIGGNLAQQVIRFGSNLLLTRLLLPEAFGLMAIVNVVLIGLQMFSDIGIGPSIIQHRRGEEPAFYNTAYTIQIIRGVLLTIAAVVIVIPVIKLLGYLTPGDPTHGVVPVYSDPQLPALIAVGALTALISGFNSTKLFTVNRRLAMGRLTLLEVITQVVGVVAMAIWAWYFQSVWALVGGGLVSAWMKMLLSHTMLPGPNNRLAFDRQAFDDLIRFGRWIFLSTSALFVANQGDRLILGFYISKTVLGIYSIAFFLSEASVQMIGSVTRRVFLPAFSRVARENPDRLRLNYYRVRLRLDALTLPAAGMLMMLGSDVVRLLYTDKYHDAGWMLQILAIRVAFACSLPTAMSCLLSIGDSKGVFAGNLGKTVALLGGIPIGWELGGLAGVVWVVALSELGSLPVLWARMAKHGLLDLKREALMPVFVAIGLLVGWLVASGLHRIG